MRFPQISVKRVVFSFAKLSCAVCLLINVTLTLTAGPVRSPDEPEPLAVITAIVVGDQSKTEAAATEVAITRAATPTVTEAAKVNTSLYVDDKLETFAGASVKVVFLTGPVEKRNEVLIGENSQVIIGSIYCPFVCQWFADLKDTFRGKTRTVNLDNQGTKYDLGVTAEGQVLRVYEGTVLVKKPEPVASLSAIPTDDVSVQDLQELRIPTEPTAPLPSPTPMKEDEVRNALQWSSKVEIAAHPSDRTEENGVIARKPEFPDSERSEKFINARFQSIWKKDPDSLVTLAKVYKDWGEGHKTLASIDEAKKIYKAQNPAWTESDKILYTEAEANAMIGNFTVAKDKVRQAAEKNPASTTTADNLLAAIQYREADAAFKRKDYATAKQLFSKADQSFLKLANKNDETRSIALANRAQSLRGLAAVAQEEKRFDESLRASEAAISNYLQSYRLQETAFVEKGVGDVYRERSRIYYAMGDDANGDKAFKRSEDIYLKTIENSKNFDDAYCSLASLYILSNQNDKAEAYLKPCLAANPTTVGAQTEVPNAVGRTKASAIVNFLQAGIVPRFTGTGNYVLRQSVVAGKKVRRGTEVVLQLGPLPGSGSK